jgi:formate hydrogenlyase subunit 3/multisubunit Na+/H+ antiporter MnhD subunit
MRTEGLLTLTTVLLPLLLALGLVARALRPAALALAPWAALPGLALAVTGGTEIDLPWLLLGTRLGLDGTSRAFLLFTAVLWLAAGPYARAYLEDDPRAPRFFAFFLATMAGNLGLVLAQDIASFYLFFALMTFAAYGLVVYTGTDEARRSRLSPPLPSP